MSKLLNKKQVMAKTSLKHSALFKMISLGRFPRWIKISDRRSAWVEEEVDQWIADRVAERDGNV